MIRRDSQQTSALPRRAVRVCQMRGGAEIGEGTKTDFQAWLNRACTGCKSSTRQCCIQVHQSQAVFVQDRRIPPKGFRQGPIRSPADSEDHEHAVSHRWPGAPAIIARHMPIDAAGFR